jgi:thiol-disulfide isomerase/thioredoxin
MANALRFAGIETLAALVGGNAPSLTDFLPIFSSTIRVTSRAPPANVVLMRRSRWFAAAVLLCAAPATAGSPPIPYSDQAFTAAQAQGQTIVIETYAYWCLPCRIQSPILERLHSQTEFHDMMIFQIGEHSSNAIWRRFKLHGYGNLIVFRGSNEIARGTPTSEVAVIALLRAAR